MAVVIGVVLAGSVALLARLAGFDRATFYATVLIVVGSYYVLFAEMAGATAELPVELLLLGLFIAAAVAGFRKSQWLIVAGLAAHGLFDLARGGILEGSGVPAWWPDFCLVYDLTAAVLLAAMLMMDRRKSAPAP